MSFTSIQFLFFFPIVTILYFAIPHRYRWLWLLISSYYFYMSWNPEYAILIAITTLISYFSGLIIEKVNNIPNEERSQRLKKLWTFFSLASNLGILIFFKYFNFINTTIVRIFSFFHVSLYIPSFDYLLPVGISFYTFQAMSYTLDVYRKDIKAQKNLGKFALYISFFPQLVAGPIEKSKNLLGQFDEQHFFDYVRIKNGLLLILWGLFQKMVVASG